jgi:hypothetical protein
MDGFNLKKLNEVESKEQYRVEVANRFGDSGAEVEINRHNIKISAKESLGYQMKNKPWFN